MATTYQLRSPVEAQRRSGEFRFNFVLRDDKWLISNIKEFIEQFWKDPSAEDPPAPGFSPADFDENGRVDFSDFILFASHFGMSITQADFDARFDLTGDGQVDFEDFLDFTKAFGNE